LDVAPSWQHPELNLSLIELRDQCPDSNPPKPIAQWLKNPSAKYDFTALRYVAIEGNIGAGKTSLAQMIARDFKGKLILERFADNPFLPEFYKDPERFAFPLEMSFLADRFQQLAEQSAQYDLFSDLIITDYDRYKSLIFAKITLTAAEFDLYQKFFHLMHRELPRPQVYVYLSQSTERLLDNIKHRGRSYEQSISADYLQKIHSGYLTHLSSETHQGQVIRVDLSDLDFVHRRSDYLKILEIISKHTA
jgi:deoxyadenosine/deoxycytidine kinase